MKYKCEKHGFITGSERVGWVSDRYDKMWCIHCLHDMLDKQCGKLILIDEDEKEL